MPHERRHERTEDEREQPSQEEDKDDVAEVEEALGDHLSDDEADRDRRKHEERVQPATLAIAYLEGHRIRSASLSGSARSGRPGAPARMVAPPE